MGGSNNQSSSSLVMHWLQSGSYHKNVEMHEAENIIASLLKVQISRECGNFAARNANQREI
jgi:hypothetical protein